MSQSSLLYLGSRGKHTPHIKKLAQFVKGDMSGSESRTSIHTVCVNSCKLGF